jgi:hypothetical protein
VIITPEEMMICTFPQVVMKEPEWKAPKRDGKAFFDRRFIAPASAIDAEAIRQQFHVVVRKPAVRHDDTVPCRHRYTVCITNQVTWYRSLAKNFHLIHV